LRHLSQSIERLQHHLWLLRQVQLRLYQTLTLRLPYLQPLANRRSELFSKLPAPLPVLGGR
jgi:hypothetical protein